MAKCEAPLGGVLDSVREVLLPNGEDTLPVKDALDGADVIGLYFSASWCTPCREFTPKLKEFYNEMKKKLPHDGRLEILLVPRDNDEAAFNAYRKTMPWPSLPRIRAISHRLNQHFKVTSIPTLVLVEPDGTVIAHNGRRLMQEDPEGLEFPWRRQPIRELITSTELQRADGSRVSSDALDGKFIGLYFSASWCPPCRRFTPKLQKCYRNLRRRNEAFEIVLVSSDRNAKDFDKYMADMPWLALPFGQRRLKEKLSEMFDIQGIPSLIILSPEMEVVTHNGKSEVCDDIEGQSFPWRPQALCQLNENRANQLNMEPHFIYFTDGTDECIAEAEALLRPMAEAEAANAEKESRKPLRFMIVGQDLETGDLVRDFANLGEEEPLLAILDIPKQLKFIGDDLVLTRDNVERLLKEYNEGRLRWLALDA